MRTLGRRQGGEGSVAVPSPPLAPPLVSLHRDVTGNRHRAQPQQRGVDESFLSFRPGGTMMDGDDEFPLVSFVGSIMSSTSIDPNINDESVEVYDDDEDTNHHDDRGAADRCGLSSPPYVNLHTSILDSSLDDDEDDDEVKSQMAEVEGNAFCALDGGECPSTPRRSRNKAAATLIPPPSGERGRRATRQLLALAETPPPTTPRGRSGVASAHELTCGGRSSSSLVDLTDRLVGMCFGGVGTATPVPPPPPTVSTPGSAGSRRHHLHYHPVPPSPHSYPRTPSGGGGKNSKKGHRSKTSCVMDALGVVQEDMFQLLGCSHESDPSNSPGQDAEGAHLQQPYWTEHSSLFCFHHRREGSALLGASSSVDSERVLGRARPARITFRERAERVRRYHAERSLPHKHTGLALLPNAPPMPAPAWARSSYHHPGQLPLIPCRRSRSLLDPPVSKFSPARRRLGQQPKHQVSGVDDPMELGYDSDPEVVWGGESARAPSIPLFPLIASPQLVPEDEGYDDEGGRDGEFSSAGDTDRVVQETLNLSWTLTWHPPPPTSAAGAGARAAPAPRGAASSAPVVVTAWLERGTLINGNTVMLEPAFMWRDAYHYPPAAARIQGSSRRQSAQRRGPAASVSPAPVLPTPHALKLLNVARILPGVAVPDGSRHLRPVASARNGCSFTVQTVQGECLVFEAASREERNRLVKRWKVAVARFVTLAILEQFEAMADEFFTPRTAVPGG